MSQPARIGIALHAGTGEPATIPNPFDKADAMYWALDDLLAAARGSREPECSARDNLASMRIVAAACRSLEERRTVAAEEIA